jgi:hypothetical protein
MRILALLVALLLGPAFAQVIQIGPSDPDYRYKVEQIRSNLILHEDVHIVGAVRDQTGAPFQNSQIELRTYVSQRRQINVRLVSTDGSGRISTTSLQVVAVFAQA